LPARDRRVKWGWRIGAQAENRRPPVEYRPEISPLDGKPAQPRGKPTGGPPVALGDAHL
jgi:hypothetical protein